MQWFYKTEQLLSLLDSSSADGRHIQRCSLDDFLSGAGKLAVVFAPDDHTSLSHYGWTLDKLVLVTLRDVASHVDIVTPGSWKAEAAQGIPPATATVVVDIDDEGDEVFYDSSGFTSPSRLLRGTAHEESYRELGSGVGLFRRLR